MAHKKKKSKPLDWRTILVTAVIDFFIGFLLTIVQKLMGE